MLLFRNVHDTFEMNELMYSKIKCVYVKDSVHNEKLPLDVIITVEQIYNNNEKVRYLINS